MQKMETPRLILHAVFEKPWMRDSPPYEPDKVTILSVIFYRSDMPEKMIFI